MRWPPRGNLQELEHPERKHSIFDENEEENFFGIETPQEEEKRPAALFNRFDSFKISHLGCTNNRSRVASIDISQGIYSNSANFKDSSLEWVSNYSAVFNELQAPSANNIPPPLSKSSHKSVKHMSSFSSFKVVVGLDGKEIKESPNSKQGGSQENENSEDEESIPSRNRSDFDEWDIYSLIENSFSFIVRRSNPEVH